MMMNLIKMVLIVKVLVMVMILLVTVSMMITMTMVDLIKMTVMEMTGATGHLVPKIILQISKKILF